LDKLIISGAGAARKMNLSLSAVNISASHVRKGGVPALCRRLLFQKLQGKTSKFDYISPLSQVQGFFTTSKLQPDNQDRSGNPSRKGVSESS
jgi:hypothetical protein